MGKQIANNTQLHSYAEITERIEGRYDVMVTTDDKWKLIRGWYLPVGPRMCFPTKWGLKEGAIKLVEYKIEEQKRIIEEAQIELAKLEDCLQRTKEINY